MPAAVAVPGAAPGRGCSPLERRTPWAVEPAFGRIVGIDVGTRTVRAPFASGRASFRRLDSAGHGVVTPHLGRRTLRLHALRQPDCAAMVHVLDTARATARCIDLPGRGSFAAAATYALVVDADRRHLWALGPGYGRVVHVDVAGQPRRRRVLVSAGSWNRTPALAVLSPDGGIALTDAYHIWIADLARRSVAAAPPHVAVALAYSPDQRRLWAIGERSRVTAPAVR